MSKGILKTETLNNIVESLQRKLNSKEGAPPLPASFSVEQIPDIIQNLYSRTGLVPSVIKQNKTIYKNLGTFAGYLTKTNENGKELSLTLASSYYFPIVVYLNNRTGFMSVVNLENSYGISQTIYPIPGSIIYILYKTQEEWETPSYSPELILQDAQDGYYSFIQMPTEIKDYFISFTSGLVPFISPELKVNYITTYDKYNLPNTYAELTWDLKMDNAPEEFLPTHIILTQYGYKNNKFEVLNTLEKTYEDFNSLQMITFDRDHEWFKNIQNVAQFVLSIVSKDDSGKIVQRADSASLIIEKCMEPNVITPPSDTTTYISIINQSSKDECYGYYHIDSYDVENRSLEDQITKTLYISPNSTFEIPLSSDIGVTMYAWGFNENKISSNIIIDSWAYSHCEHEWKVSTTATCTEDGIETRTCIHCGLEETYYAQALGHDFFDDIVYENYDCIAGGEMGIACERCSTVESFDMAPNGEHSWGDWTINSEPTCTTPGSKTRVCGLCGATDTEEIPSLGHDYSILISAQAATCTEKGWEEYDCANGCGSTHIEDIEATGHDFPPSGILPCAKCGASPPGVEIK